MRAACRLIWRCEGFIPCLDDFHDSSSPNASMPLQRRSHAVLNAKPPKRWKYFERRAKQAARRKAELSDRGSQVEKAE